MHLSQFHYLPLTPGFFSILVALFVGLLVILVVIGAAVWLAFSLSGRIAKVLGKTGINVMTRLMGLLLAALAVEVMSDGLVKLFPILAGNVR